MRKARILHDSWGCVHRIQQSFRSNQQNEIPSSRALFLDPLSFSLDPFSPILCPLTFILYPFAVRS